MEAQGKHNAQWHIVETQQVFLARLYSSGKNFHLWIFHNKYIYLSLGASTPKLIISPSYLSGSAMAFHPGASIT